MSGWGSAVSSIFLYTLLSLIVLLYAFDAYRKAIQNKTLDQKFSMLGVVVVAILFSLINVYCTYLSNGYGGDRRNYYYNYMHGRISGYGGFDFLLQFFKQTFDSYNLFLYFITFLVVLVVLLIYKYSNQATPYALIFIFASNLIFFSFAGLKQSLGCVFANLFFSLELSARKHKGVALMSILLAVISCFFHSTGAILFLIFVLLRLDFKNKNITIMTDIIVFTFILLFMRPLSLFLGDQIEDVMPQVSTTINTYFGDDEYSEGILQVFRGFPFYFMSFYALKHRGKFLERIPYYDKYLIIAVLGSVLYMYSAVSYWYSRFIVVFYIPLAFLFGQMMLNSFLPNQRRIMMFMIIGTLYFFTIRNLFMVFTVYGIL